MNEFKLRRLGTIMQPEPGNEMELEGVLNPAAIRGPDGFLYLFPRLVGKAITRASVSQECCLMRPVIRWVSNGWVLLWSPRPIMKNVLVAQVDAKMHEFPLWNPYSAI